MRLAIADPYRYIRQTLGNLVLFPSALVSLWSNTDVLQQTTALDLVRLTEWCGSVGPNYLLKT